MSDLRSAPSPQPDLDELPARSAVPACCTGCSGTCEYRRLKKIATIRDLILQADFIGPEAISTLVAILPCIDVESHIDTLHNILLAQDDATLVAIARTFFDGLLEFRSTGGASPSDERREVDQGLYAVAASVFPTAGGYARPPITEHQRQLKFARASADHSDMKKVRAREGDRGILSGHQSTQICHIIPHSVAAYKNEQHSPFWLCLGILYGGSLRQEVTSLVCASNSNSPLNMFVLDTQWHGCFDKAELRFKAVSSGREKYDGEGSDAVGTNRVLYLTFHHGARRGEMDLPARFIPSLTRNQIRLHYSSGGKAAYTERVFNPVGYGELMKPGIDKLTICTVDPKVCALPSGLFFSIRNTIWNLINAAGLSVSHTARKRKAGSSNVSSEDNDHADYSASGKDNDTDNSRPGGSKRSKNSHRRPSPRNGNGSSANIGTAHTASNSLHTFAWEKRGYSTMWDDPVCRRYAFDFHDPLIDGKYDSEDEDDPGTASDVGSVRESTIPSGYTTPSSIGPLQAPDADDDVGPLLQTATRSSTSAIRGRSRSESSIASVHRTSSSGHRTPILSTMRRNSGLSSKSIGSSSSVHSLAGSPIISPKSLPNVQAAQ